jgi:hypothetical protein
MSKELPHESVMCCIVCCRGWRWNRSTAGDSLVAHCCYCSRGGKPQGKPGQLASSPVTLSVMGKGDKRGHAQRADGKSALDNTQNKTSRSVKFTYHTRALSQNNSVGIAMGWTAPGSIPGRSKIFLFVTASRLALELTTFLPNRYRGKAARTWSCSYNSTPPYVFLAWWLIN